MSGLLTFLGTTQGAFYLVTILFGGGCAWMTGRGLALTWHSPVQAILYALLLGIGDRFLGFALFQAALLSPQGYLCDTAFFLLLALGSFRLHRARQMVAQYPWLYERAGLLAWRERNSADIPH